ncbi:MAG: SusC/RagA family TonB-linked outer membrane protein [Chitinophagales bacterium]|nr:SusC/RagA family TonB-linked outer membrane protein [Chitinophagales bacterium]
MKITAVILLAACLSAAATGKAQKVSLTLRDAPLEKALKEIKRQTGLDLLYTVDVLQHARPVTIELRNADLRQALDQCFKEQPLTYTIVENVIVVKLRPVTSAEGVGEEVVALPIDVKGRVVDTAGNPVAGASVTVKGDRTKGTTTDENGYFELKGVEEDAVLVVSGVNIERYEVRVAGKSDLATLTIKTKVTEGLEVTIKANTGYQEIEPNRATGSVAVIDNKALNQQTGTNILKRLEGVTSGLLFDNNKVRNSGGSPKNDNITIRGLSTINASMDPLIVLDGFIYEGGINNINPNDVESITILKDAAATSIWGARAGNGVIVITSKKGKFNQKLQVSFNANTIISEKSDLSYLPQMSSTDYIDVEEFLFKQNFSGFTSRINSKYLSLTPAVDVLLKRKNGLISATDSATQINAMKATDVRDQYNKYVYKTAVTQQYYVNLNGGSNNNAYTISFGFDNLSGELQNKFQKLNIKVENTYKPVKNLQLSFGVYYTNSKATTGIPGLGSIRPGGRPVPYFRLADNDGSPVSVAAVYRDTYIDTAGAGKLFNWKFYPLEDWKHNKTTTNLQELFTNIGLQYKLTKSLNIDLKYQYQRQQSQGEQLADMESYYTRDLINSFSQLNRNTGIVNYIIPKGDIRTLQNNFITSYTVRGQLNFNQTWFDHQVAAIAGVETRESKADGDQYTAYGYNEDPLVTASVDFRNTYPTFITGAFNTLPGAPGFVSSVFRYVSAYGNASYSYKQRYILSVSIRKDGSNIFGVKTNDKWKPLWSLGAAWKISDELFYKSAMFPLLKLRTTYGYSGNVDPSKSAVPVGAYGSAPVTGFPYARIGTLNDPELRWERSGMLNIGIDFALKNNLITGSLEFYSKNGTDLYGPSLYDYTVWGYINQVTINSANMNGKGVDIVLTSKNIDKAFKWYTTLLFNYNKDRVTKYFGTTASRISTKINAASGIAPVVGKPLYAIAAYKWGGLNANGDPQGYLNGQLSTDYTAISNEGLARGLDGNIVYIGPSSPPVFGSLMNGITWKNFTLTTLISYKLGYYFRRPSLSYTLLINNGVGNKDYEIRWQVPGDEAITNVPAFKYPLSANNQKRDDFYNSSEVNVLKAGNIRLQYINLSYSFIKNRPVSSLFKELELYGNMANVGILWRANKENLDPEYPTSLPPVRSWTLGVRANF